MPKTVNDLNKHKFISFGKGAPFPNEINLCLFKSLTVLGIPFFSKYLLDP